MTAPLTDGPLCGRCGEQCMEQDECNACDGTGRVQDDRDWSFGGLIYMEMPCSWCRGTGLTWYETCEPEDEPLYCTKCGESEANCVCPEPFLDALD